MAEFASTYNSAKDMIYGRGEAINVYILNFCWTNGKGEHLKLDYRDRLTPDQWDYCIKKKSEDFFAINTFNQFMSNSDYITSQTDTSIKDYLANYKDSLDASPYKPKQLALSKASEYEDKFKKSNAKLSKLSPLATIQAAAKDMCIRRSCKFGIEYVTRNLDGTIHYALDGIDVGKVCDKATITNGSGYQKLPICTSELRFLFRNWGTFKGGKVLFWKSFETSSPPWEISHQNKWKAYAISRITKYWTKLSSSPVGQDWLKNNGADAKNKDPSLIALGKLQAKALIGSFHAIPVNLVNDEAAEIV